MKALIVQLFERPFERWIRLTINDRFLLTLLAGLYFVYLLRAFPNESPWAHFFFTLNYLALVAIINYYWLPLFFYKRQYVYFVIATILTTLVAGYVEEGVLEKIFYPDSRGNGPVLWKHIRYVFIELTPMVIFLLGFKLAWDHAAQQRREDLLAKEKVESELNFLKSQINPHVLFNNLNNIYSYSLEGSQKAPAMILKLSDLMRYMLYECEEAYVPLSKEIIYLTNYIELQEIQMEGRGKAHFQVIGDPGGYRIAPLLLIAFVENCFKHSMESQIDGIEIKITIRIFEGVFDFTAENNFEPEKATTDRQGGIGLTNVKKRLELLYKDRYELHIQCTEDHFYVNLRIQLL